MYCINPLPVRNNAALLHSSTKTSSIDTQLQIVERHHKLNLNSWCTLSLWTQKILTATYEPITEHLCWPLALNIVFSSPLRHPAYSFPQLPPSQYLISNVQLVQFVQFVYLHLAVITWLISPCASPQAPNTLPPITPNFSFTALCRELDSCRKFDKHEQIWSCSHFMASTMAFWLIFWWRKCR